MPDDDRFILQSRAIVERLVKEGLEIGHFQVPSGVSFSVPLKEDEGGSIVVAANTVVELGHPLTTSFCLGLMTARRDLITEGQVTVIGREVEALPRGRHSFALIVLSRVAKPGDAERRAVMKCMLSLDLLAGCMVRTSSNRIWIRFSQDALDRCLSFKDMGAFLLSELKKGGFGTAEVIFVTGEAGHVNELGVVAEGVAEERSGRYREALVEKMACETGLDCDECPETDTCRVLKDAVAAARRRKGTG